MAAIAAPYQSIARRCKMPWSKLLFSSFSPSKSHRIELEENFISSFLSLSLFLVNLQEENRQTVGIDGFEVIFVGSDPSEAR